MNNSHQPPLRTPAKRLSGNTLAIALHQAIDQILISDSGKARRILNAISDEHLRVCEERDALSAHVERLQQAVKSATTSSEIAHICESWMTTTHEASLARRDARMKAEALKEADDYIPIRQVEARIAVKDMARKYRRLAEPGETP